MSKKYLNADEQDENVAKINRLSDWKAFVILLRYVEPYKYPIGFGIILILGSTFLSIGSARFMGSLVEEGLLLKDSSKSFFFAFLIILLEVFSLFFVWGGRRMITKESSLTLYDVRRALFTHLQKLPLSFYDRQPQGRIVTRITHDVEGMEEFFTNSMGRLFGAGFMAVSAMTAMLLTHFKIGSLLILTIFPAIFYVYYSRVKMRKINRGLSVTNTAVNSKLSEYLNGIEVIRNFGLEEWSKEQFDKDIADYLDAHIGANKFYGMNRPFMSFLCSLPMIALVWFGGQEVLAGTFSVGLFVTFIRYCERFFQPLMILAREFHAVQQAFTSTERVAGFLNHATEEVELGDDGHLSPAARTLRGKLEFKNVKMAYQDENWVLKDLNFTIRPGEKIGLVGRTGCGKSTTVSLLLRLYAYQQGEILLDGHEIKDFKREYLRDQIGFVGQEAILYRGTLKENLVAHDEISQEDIWHACEVTGLAKIMRQKKQGLEFFVLEGGSNLSAGERALVALTRILLKNPAILIMDEATASIDPWYEKIIHQAVDKVMKGRTCLLIAHRLKTLEGCTRILVFDNGQLVEEGPQQELMDRNGHFKSLYSAQSTHQQS
jgi:ATP-binding cassette, subfamily B, multidrug efflux pump